MLVIVNTNEAHFNTRRANISNDPRYWLLASNVLEDNKGELLSDTEKN
jgi:hypothetical protein